MGETLTVVGQVHIDFDRGVTVNRGFNVLLGEYAEHFDRIQYIGPSRRSVQLTKSAIHGDLHLSSCGDYGVSLTKKTRFLASAPNVIARFRRLLSAFDPGVIQLRIPSLYTLLAYRPAIESGEVVTSYVAGDWSGAFAANYPGWPSRLVGRFLERLQRPVIRNTITVASGPALSRQYEHLGPVHAYYATTHRQVRRKEKVADSPSKLLYVGRLSKLKRVEDVIDAAARLVGTGEDVRLAVVGRGRLETALRERVRDAGLGEHVTFHGYIDDWDALSDLYLEADVLMFPSVSEGAVKVLTEAMAHGVVPVCVRGTGSNDEIIRHGENGMLVEPRSPRDLAAAVRQLRSMPGERYRAVVEACYSHAEHHTLPAEVRRMWDFVRQEGGAEAPRFA